jgi:hypothetical protein
MRKLFVITLLTMSTNLFASTHFVGRTLEPTAKLAYFGAKKSVYPVRHPISTTKGVAKGVAATAKAVF